MRNLAKGKRTGKIHNIIKRRSKMDSLWYKDFNQKAYSRAAA